MKTSWAVAVAAAGMMLLGSVAGAQEACKISRATRDGQELVTIENAFVSMTFAPAHGGLCTRFLYKPTSADWTDDPQKYACVLDDQVWFPLSSKADWEDAAYKLTVLKETPGEVSVELSGQGKSGLMAFAVFHKTIALTRDSSAVRVHYAFEIINEAMSAQDVGLWFQNRLAFGGKKIATYLPVKNGVKRLDYDPSIPSEEYWEYDLSRGWIGVVGEGGSGLAARMDYSRLMCLYEWFEARVMTMEWMFRIASIPNNSTLETDVVLVPFDGLERLDGVGAGGAAAIGAEVNAEKKVVATADVYLSEPAEGMAAVWSWRKQPEVTWRQIGAAAPVTITKPGAWKTACSWKPDADGIYGLRIQVLEGAQVVVEAEKPVNVGKVPDDYVMLPESERKGDPKDHFGKVVVKAEEAEIPWRTDVVTPHVEWGKPYAKGKTKALFLMHYFNSREIVELAERMDLEFDAPLVSYENPYVGDAYRSTNQQIQTEIVQRYLKKTGYDVIVVSGLNWNQFPKAAADLLAEQVRKGVGLVYIAPRDLPKDEDWSMFGPDLKKILASGSSTWQPLEKDAVFTGVPTEVLPAAGIVGYAPPDAKPFLFARSPYGTMPIGLTREKDGQRTVFLNYLTSRSPGWGETLTPFIRYPKERFHYWEYHHSLLAKAILWASRHEPDVQLAVTVDSAQASSGSNSINATVAVSGPLADLGKITAECTVRDGWSVEISRQSLDLTAAPKATFAITQDLPVGVYFVDVIVKCQGRVLNWGSAAFHVSGDTAIASFELPEPNAPSGAHIYRTGMEAAPVAKVRNAKEGMFLACEYSDKLGRLIARKEIPVPAGADAVVKVPFAVDRPQATVGYIRVELEDGTQRVYARADVDFVTLPDRFASSVWDDFEWIPMAGMGACYQEYLIPTAARQVREAGLTTLYGNSGWDDGADLRTEHESALRAGFRIIESGLWEGYPSSWAEDQKKFAETHDKKYLERKPSLSDPEYRKRSIEKTHEKVAKFRAYVPLGWMWGDEQSVIGRIEALDYDFSPVALEDFRGWLEKEYGSLDALNKEWKTAYTAWDQAVPLTLGEAQASRNYAPWADHRTFMEVCFTDFHGMLQKALLEDCPGARTGPSGTSAPAAYNGCDWTRFCETFRFLQPYYYGGQEELIPAFSPTAARAPWSTGYGNESQNGDVAWVALLRGDRGVSFFTLGSFINPDYTLSRSARSSAGAVTAIQKSALARLFIGLDSYYDPIGILFSQRAVQGAYVINRQWVSSHDGWYRSLYDLGYSPRPISYEQLDAGALNGGKFKVCILPMTTAISGLQAAELRRFVEAGGVLLTDNRAGILDGHCSIAIPGMLDGVFGIRHTAFNAPGAATEIRFARNPAVPVDMSALALDSEIPEGGIALDGATALGEANGTPYGIFNAPGKGWTCYLNVDLGKYAAARQATGGDFYRGIVTALLARAQVAPSWRVEPMVKEWRIGGFVDGGARYMGYVPARAKPKAKAEPRTVRLDKPMHVYDCQDGTYFGLTDRFESKSPDRAADVFALLPYEVTGLELPAGLSAKRGEWLSVPVSVITGGGAPVKHAVHATVLRPDGTEMECYSTNLALPNGKGTLEIPFALNDPTGNWRLKVRDAATGVATEVGVTLAE